MVCWLFLRREAEHVAWIATIHFLEKILLKIMIGAIGIMGILAITNLETIACIYTVLVIVGQLLILKMGRQDMDPRFRLMSAHIVVVLRCVRCCLLRFVSCLGRFSFFVSSNWWTHKHSLRSRELWPLSVFLKLWFALWEAGIDVHCAYVGRDTNLLLYYYYLRDTNLCLVILLPRTSYVSESIICDVMKVMVLLS